MNNTSFRRAFLALSHPVSILAILVVLLNDHWWRQVSPSWFTGKVGDFAWLIFAPFLLAVLLAWLFPQREKFAGYASIIGVGLIFGLAKTVPAIHMAVISFFAALFGWQASLRLDPTDLLALPALVIAWLIWKRSDSAALSLRRRGWILVFSGMLATVANQPVIPDYGINCLAEKDGVLMALPYPRYRYSSHGQVFVSEDGGLSWRAESPAPDLQVICNEPADIWQMPDPAAEQIQYRFTPGATIERSENGGASWQREVNLTGEEPRRSYYTRFRGESVSALVEAKSGPLDALVDVPTGNVVVAMGYAGVLVRTPDAVWHGVSVGPYFLGELNAVDMLPLLSGEMWLMVEFAFLISAMSAPHLEKSRVRNFFLVVAVLLWFTGVISSPAVSYATGKSSMIDIYTPLINLVVPVCGLMAIPLGLQGAIKVYQLAPQAIVRLLALAVASAVLCLIPYLLWSQSVIPAYAGAMLLVCLFAIACAIGSTWYVERYIKSVTSEPGKQTSAP